MKNLVDLLQMTEKQLFNKVVEAAEISEVYEIYKTPNYILILPKNVDKILPTLSAHLDLVGGIPPKKEDILVEGNIISLSKNSQASCLGGDDRCGVWIILELLKEGNSNYNYLLFTQEEVGCIGSYNFVESHKTLPFLTNCFVGLDRGAGDHIALYGVDSDSLNSIFEGKGYHVEFGSCTDVAVLSRAYEVPAVNLSIGYRNQHTKRETINFNETKNTLEVLKSLDLRDLKFPITFTEDYEFFDWSYEEEFYDFEPCECEICGSDSKLFYNGDIFLCEMCLYNKEGGLYDF